MAHWSTEEVWELDDQELDCVRGGQSGPGWDVLWIGGSDELKAPSDPLLRWRLERRCFDGA